MQVDINSLSNMQEEFRNGFFTVEMLSFRNKCTSIVNVKKIVSL